MWQCGESLRTAQDKVRVAHALAALPAIRAEFAAGRLSYSKVRAITRVADDRTIPQPGDDPLHARQADALVAICAGTADPSPATVVVHVDADTLNHDADGACHLDNSANLAPETARRLACDATSHDVIERDGEPIATTKAASSLPPRLRRDLAARDRGCCRIPGCGRTGRVHAHHIIHRAHHGPNTLENLLTLCPFHHRLVHEAGYRVEVLLDQVIVHRPGRPPLTESNPPPPTGPDVPARNELRQLHIDPDTIVCDWDGSPLPRRPLLHHRRPQQRRPLHLTPPARRLLVLPFDPPGAWRLL